MNKNREIAIPSVLCIGFAKCGTTTVYDIFSQNTNIHLSGIKEPVYYGYDKLYKKGFDWYKKRFYQQVNGKTVVEINPRIAKYAKAKDIYNDYGKDTKIIILIRNPINRLYSNFKMNLNTGKCFNNIKAHIDNDTSKLFDKWVKENFYIKRNKVNIHDNINTNKMLNGEYYSVIKDYIDVFGKDNVHICIFEDFIKDKEKYSKEMFDFIGVDYDNINYNVHVNKGNHIPRNILDIKINSFCINHLWKDIFIGKFKYISNNFSRMFNNLVWKCPVVFSKVNNISLKTSDYANKVITLYYYDMIKKLSELIDIDLFLKWELERDKDKLWKF